MKTGIYYFIYTLYIYWLTVLFTILLVEETEGKKIWLTNTTESEIKCAEHVRTPWSDATNELNLWLNNNQFFGVEWIIYEQKEEKSRQKKKNIQTHTVREKMCDEMWEREGQIEENNKQYIYVRIALNECMRVWVWERSSQVAFRINVDNENKWDEKR